MSNQTEEVDPTLVSALGRLDRRRSKRVRFVQQLEAADCGAACLAMVADFHGRHLTLDDARSATGVNRGTDALKIMQAAERLGLRGRCIRIELEAIAYLPAGSILHWGMNHFVVLDRVNRRTVDIVDPAFGRRRVPLEQFRKQFTGVALVFEPADDFVTTPRGRSKTWRYLVHLAAQRALLGRVLVISIALRVLVLAVPVLTATIIDRVVPRGDRPMLAVVGGAIVTVAAFHALSTLIRAHLLIELRTRMDARMTLGFLGHLLRLPYAFFTRRTSGDLMARVQSNTQIRELLTSSLLSTLLDGGLAVMYLILLAIVSPTLALVASVAALMQILALVLARRRYAELTARDLETQARAQGYLVQMLVGIETLRIGGAEERALEHWTNLYVDGVNVALSRSRMMALLDTFNALLQLATPLVLLSIGALSVMDQSLSLGAMLGAIALATGFLSPLTDLVNTVMRLQMLGSYIERIDDVISTQPEQRRESTIAPPPLSGAVELRDVSFRYGPHEPFVVRNVSMTIEPGSKIAIVGRSGSGKSTLAALLLGLHRPTEGSIVYDNYDLAELDHRLLRQRFGVVPQSAFIFSASIRNNITLADPSVPFDRIKAAARRACIDEDIRAMPMGYETIVAEGGATLSGGQRQRIALARALLRDPVALLLDEATSSLDVTTERQIMANLAERSATRIVIAHRLSTIIDADKILVMKDGRIVEAGTHADLFAKDGVYTALVRNQAFVAEPT
jgi:ABC-type bacteriocin/lantibiotic exporter with double-glycine peptidase domain